ncbi:MAG: acyl carrier protein [Lachnospiraceae bacterium]|nr:acyl carrier protein [Lachnospiraceae bacterium]
MLEKLVKVLAEQLMVDPETITENTRIKEDLGADSLDILQIVMTFEEEYGITIPDDDLAGFETVGDILAYFEKNE